MPLTAYGDPAVPVTVELKNVEVSLRDGFESIDFMQVANHKKIVLENVKIDNFAGNALIKTWTQGNVEINDLVCNIKDENRVVLTDEEVWSDARVTLMANFPNMMRFAVENSKTMSEIEVGPLDLAEEKTELELFQEFYALQNGGAEPDGQRMDIVGEIFESLREEKE